MSLSNQYLVGYVICTDYLTISSCSITYILNIYIFKKVDLTQLIN